MNESKGINKQKLDNYYYNILKLTAKKLFNSDLNIKLSKREASEHFIEEPDNGYFDLVRRLTDNQLYYKSTDAKNPQYLSEIIFIDCAYNQSTYNEEQIEWAEKYDEKQLKKFNRIKLSYEKQLAKLNTASTCNDNIEQAEKLHKIINKYRTKIDTYPDKRSVAKRYKNRNKSVKEFEANLDILLTDGFVFNGKKYYLLGMSSSMARNGIKGFVSENIYDEIMLYSYLVEKPEKCKIAKYEAYRNLLFTSCRAYVDELPRIVVIDDYSMVIPSVEVRYPADGYYLKEKQEDKEKKTVIQIPRKVMKSDVKDILINCFDGSAIHSSEYNATLYKALSGERNIPKSYQLRLPFFKGLSTCFDIKGFCKEQNVTHIKDIDGKLVPIDEIDILAVRSMYKGADYFESFKTYCEAVKDKGFKLGISNYNKSSKDISDYTLANYQYLQNISGLTKEDLIELSQYFTKSVEEILKNPKKALEFYNIDNTEEDEGSESVNTEADDEAIDTADINNTDRDSDISEGEFLTSRKIPYQLQALAINKDMMNDTCVRSTISRFVKSSIKRAKYGRIPLKGGYKYLVPDLYMFMNWACHQSGHEEIEVKSSLMPGQLYCSGKPEGTYSLFRSPQLLENEINVLQLINTDITERWYSHLDNVIVINSCSVDMMRMQTADHDGDAAFLCEEDRITSKVKTGLPLIINNDDVKPPLVEYTQENIIDYHKKTLDCMIGQITNKSTKLHNKNSKGKITSKLMLDGEIDSTRNKINEDLEYLCIQIQLETDYVKNGIRWDTPLDIENSLGELPYFMRYRYDKIDKEYKLMDTKRKGATYRIRQKYKENGMKSENDMKQEIKNKLYESKYKLPVNRSRTPLNELCWYLEKWSPIMRYIYKTKDVSKLFIPDGYEVNEAKLKLMYDISVQYMNETSEIMKKRKSVNWNALYKRYRDLYLMICPDLREILYYLVKMSYGNQMPVVEEIPVQNQDESKNESPSKKNIVISKNLVWSICGEEIIEILKERKAAVANNRTTEESDAANQGAA